jgi:alpha-D-xyloside xylohydrolase
MRRSTRAWWLGSLLSAAALPGCFGDETTTMMMPPPTSSAVSIAAGDFAVRVDPGTGEIALVSGSDVLLSFPKDALQLGLLPALDDNANYDPVPIVAPTALHMPPDGLVWVSPDKVDATPGGKGPLSAALTYPNGRKATLTVFAPQPGSFKLLLKAEDASDGAVAYFRLRPRIDTKEGLYGLGESFDDVNQRNHVRPMQIEIDTSTETGYNNVHVPIPFLLGTRGWGLFVESPYPGVFSVATETTPGTPSDLVEAIFGTGLASKDGLTFHLFGEKKPLDLTKHYYDATGYPRLPARWALGPWVWRDENKDQAQAEGDLQAMRDLDLPATAYWVDRPYAVGVNTFDWNTTQFPDPQKLIDKAHDLGFGFALWHTPVLDDKDPATATLRMEAMDKGYYPKVSGVKLNPWGKLIDFTNPDAKIWWQGLIANYTAMGVEGFKLDYAEDVVPGLTGARNVWEFADGSDERTMHARYQLFYHQTYQETLTSPGGSFLLCRHATYGDQQNLSVIWPGDLDAAFAKNGETTSEGDDKPYVAVGGLPASLVAGLSLGPSGFPFFGADTGGYIHSPPDKELFSRWCEQTALSTVMQVGNSASTVPWEPDPKTGYDAELLGWYRTYARLHLRLFPYAWTYAENLAKDGRPIARPLGLAYPELGVHPNDEYMFGDYLLVAPVLARGVTSRPVVLPAGKWIDWWNGQIVDGGGTVTADAPLGKLPLYLAEGGIVPMLRPTIDTLRATTQPSIVDSYATDPGVLWVRVAPGAASSFTLFDGAVVGQERGAEGIKLTASDGKELTSGVMFEVVAYGGKKPSAVSEKGSPLAEAASVDALAKAASGWVYVGETGGTVFVKTLPGQHAVTISP